MILALGMVETKTRVSVSSLSEVVHNSASKFYSAQCNSPDITAAVPQDHLLQMMHQCVVLGVNTALYACAAETSLLYRVAV